jgi:hypothetical protein
MRRRTRVITTIIQQTSYLRFLKTRNNVPLRTQEPWQFGLTKFTGDFTPRYAILSHTCGAEDDEITFRDIENGARMNKARCSKIKFCGKQAASDNLR